MARLARVVVPGVAHHVTQRGNRRQEAFCNEDDYDAYLALLKQWCSCCGVAVWAYCLMPNHVHLIVVPDWHEFLTEGLDVEEAALLRRHERTGRPLGEAAFLDRIEKRLGRQVRPPKPGRKPKRREK